MTPIPSEALKAFTPEQQRLLRSLIENIETITGQRPRLVPIKALPPGSALGAVILKINEILERLQ